MACVVVVAVTARQWLRRGRRSLRSIYPRVVTTAWRSAVCCARHLCRPRSSGQATSLPRPVGIHPLPSGARLKALCTRSVLQLRDQLLPPSVWTRSVQTCTQPAPCQRSRISAARQASSSKAHPFDPSEAPHHYVWSNKMSVARVYADVNSKRPEEYWDYESLQVQWGCVVWWCSGTCSCAAHSS